MLVDSKTTSGAFFAIRASSHRDAHKHQKSPSFNPAKSYSGIGVDKSLPCSFDWTI